MITDPDRQGDVADAEAEWWANVEPGCYVDGHWGIYATEHLADKFPDVVTDDERDIISAHRAGADVGEEYSELAYELEERIDERLPDDLRAHWWDGEFYISKWCGRDHDESSECTDGECFCHCD